MNYAVSVIIPVFKVESFIGRCVRYLFEQTLKEVEYIFIDDCSPDNSITVLQGVMEEYPHRKHDVTIVRHEQNRGLPSARNSGLQIASGEYIFHCDSDDYLDRDALFLLYDEAKKQNADAVWCDWYLSFRNNERYMSQAPVDSQYVSVMSTLEMMLGGKIRFNVWNKLVRRQLYTANDIRFPDGYGMGEDMTMIKLFAYAEKVSYLPMALYHYVQLNENAFTKKTTDQHLLQIQYNVDHIVHFLKQKYGSDLNTFIQFFKLNTKLPFLISNDTKSYERWLAWYPEANDYVTANPMFSKRTRIIQHFAIRRQFWILRLHYYLVIRVVYGLIYR
ncbi:glycosyltransferase family 2 protein [Sphingobacterium spiritivorum]|uniref:glycosyltransferase family 2 protein n=1 Tax=Sphingobacterium spiritivorum TaxID=258 RepID=UPI003DA29408